VSSWWTVRHESLDGDRCFGVEEVLAVNGTHAAEEAVKTWLRESGVDLDSSPAARSPSVDVLVYKTGESDVTPLLRLRVKAKLEWTARAEPLPPDRVTDAGPTR